MHTEPDPFGADDIDGIVEFFSANGYARIGGVYTEADLDDLQQEMERLQRELLAGRLPEKCGTVILDDPEAMVDGHPFAHYVCHATQVSESADRAAHAPVITETVSRLLGSEAWLLDHERFGVVYQDARPGRDSGYSRIGWHTDWQSGPHLGIWPSVAFTIHLDATSPANGFLRVLPGSHLGDTEGIPLGFEKVPGEIAVYCDRGDVLFHDAHLWHSAARATEDPPGGVRRHLRGSWHTGVRLAEGHGVEDFVKNAAR
ncbi:MAG: phytanoyl-CoA dioxygenase family protein [Acidobacteria bacterium]|nr:phytanoyl-CoA dioxygenase family protein [Acidobacteriota bacterium]